MKNTTFTKSALLATLLLAPAAIQAVVLTDALIEAPVIAAAPALGLALKAQDIERDLNQASSAYISALIENNNAMIPEDTTVAQGIYKKTRFKDTTINAASLTMNGLITGTLLTALGANPVIALAGAGIAASTHYLSQSPYRTMCNARTAYIRALENNADNITALDQEYGTATQQYHFSLYDNFMRNSFGGTKGQIIAANVVLGAAVAFKVLGTMLFAQ